MHLQLALSVQYTYMYDVPYCVEKTACKQQDAAALFEPITSTDLTTWFFESIRWSALVHIFLNACHCSCCRFLHNSKHLGIMPWVDECFMLCPDDCNLTMPRSYSLSSFRPVLRSYITTFHLKCLDSDAIGQWIRLVGIFENCCTEIKTRSRSSRVGRLWIVA